MRWIALGLVAFAVSGCAPSHINVRPQSSDVLLSKGEDALVAFVRAPESGAGGLDVRVSSTGVFRHKHKGDASVSLPVSIEVENRSETELASFDPRGVVLSGGLRRELEPIAPVGSAVSGDSTAVTIEPGAKRTFHLEFSTASTGDPRELAPFTLRMTFNYGRRELPVTVSFIRHEEVRYYGYPAYYYGYPGGYYGYPYYGGPYGRYGWGPGFYGGASWGW